MVLPTKSGGGKTKVGGTSYSIEKGKTKKGGTNYTIEVAGKCNIEISGSPTGQYGVAGYGTVAWTSTINGSTMTVGTTQVPKGSTVTVSITITQQVGWSGSAQVYYNGVATGSATYSYTATKDHSITVGIPSTGLGIYITQS